MADIFLPAVAIVPGMLTPQPGETFIEDEAHQTLFTSGAHSVPLSSDATATDTFNLATGALAPNDILVIDQFNVQEQAQDASGQLSLLDINVGYAVANMFAGQWLKTPVTNVFPKLANGGPIYIFNFPALRMRTITSGTVAGARSVIMFVNATVRNADAVGAHSYLHVVTVSWRTIKGAKS
jgi:hypothetical protein